MLAKEAPFFLSLPHWLSSTSPTSEEDPFSPAETEDSLSASTALPII